MLPPSTSSAPLDAGSSYPARHQALLEEYSRLLEKLRNTPSTASALTNTYLKPHPGSPLDLDAKNPSIARKLKLTLRPDGQFSLARMALYYGISPWNPADKEEHQAALRALEEKRARHGLQLERGIDVDSLACTPNLEEHQALRKSRSLPPKERLPLSTLLGRLTESKIREAIRQFLPASVKSLIGHLAKNLASDITAARVRQTPTVYLEQILQSADASQLAKSLLTKLGWYGSDTEQDDSPLVRNKLLSRAIRLWEQRDTDAERDIAGYPWHQRSNYGKSYQAIWSEFEDHLLSSNRVTSEIEAVLLACLYRCEFPIDFHRSDTPVDLPYRSSLVWVNFVHGLHLADAIEPDRVPHMTFQQLVDFPLEESTEATEQELDIVAWSRIAPAMDWAVANGIVQEDRNAEYSESTKKRVMEALDQHTEVMKTTLKQLDIDPPKRWEIADREIKKVFGQQVFTSDGRKLVRYLGPDTGSRFVPDLRQKSVSFRDVYMWKGHKDKTWLITGYDGESVSTARFSIRSDGSIETTAKWIPEAIRLRTLPDVNVLFESQYNTYLNMIKSAYRQLLISLFSHLPHDDRLAIEYGETKIYTVRSSTKDLEASQEKPSLTMPLRLRMGFILSMTYNDRTCWYECLPRAGIIRQRTDFNADMLNGRLTTEEWRIRGKVRVTVRRGKPVPLDWDAYEIGRAPKKEATCIAIIEQLGVTFPPEAPTGHPPAITSKRASEIALFIARDHLYVAEDKLYANARQQTELEKAEERRHTLLIKIGKWVPFFGNLDDLHSDDPRKSINAVFGMFTDTLSFALPLGKFVSGSARLASTAVRLGYKQVLPQFSRLTQKLLITSLRNFNPLDGAPTLGKVLVHGLYAVNRLALRAAIRQINRLTGRAGSYDFVKGLPQVTDPGSYKLLAASDNLVSTRGFDDLPARRVDSATLLDYRMLDPMTDKPFGPPLADKLYRLSLGRSAYRPIQKTDQHVFVEVAEHAKIRELPEIDGQMTVYIDNVPYRLDGDWLRRIELIDESSKFKRTSCRIKRAPGSDICVNEFITGDPHPDTPPLRSFDPNKGYAPWFGERLCTPQARHSVEGEYFLRDGRLYHLLNGEPKRWKGDFTQLGFAQKKPVPKDVILADVQFQKGIYVRIEIQGSYQDSNELHRIGAIVVPSLVTSDNLLFTRVNTDKYYLATFPADKDLSELQTLTMKQLSQDDLMEGTRGAELLRTYEGSLTANNLAAIYGTDAVERAMKTMERIAIPLGTPPNPPANMQWIKLDTSPGEALMFDQRTRMIVTQSSEGATTWSRSHEASETLRQRTAEIFDTLFMEQTIPQNTESLFRIDRTMKKLNDLLPKSQRRSNPRNIAYAEVIKTDGVREVYVSVSGAQGTTGKLPLFKTYLGAEHVQRGDATYFNVDLSGPPTRSGLLMDSHENLLAIPKTYPELPAVPTSLDSESKLISFIHRKYPDKQTIRSVNIATTMPPCEACAVIVKAFGHTGANDWLNVIWR